MICQISGTAPEEPVVSKYGHTYERRLIEKYLETNGNKCPVTNEPLSREDLIVVKAGKVVKPRPANATSVPAILQLFQNEWDSLMLETFTLKSQLETARQELAQSLYQHDAACRVIARLTKERDEARSALANARATLSAAVATSAAAAAAAGGSSSSEGAAADSMQVDQQAKAATTTALSDEVKTRLTKTATELSAARRNRTISPSVATVEAVNSFAVSKAHAVLAAATTSLDVHPTNENLVVTGSADKSVLIHDRADGKEKAKLSQHSKRVNDVAFHPAHDVVLSASQDRTAIVWTAAGEGAKKSYKVAHTLSHLDDVTSVAVHPVADFIATSSLDRTWALHDLRTGTTLTHFQDPEAGYRCGNFHPDGLLYGAGTSASVIRIWDLKAARVVSSLTGHAGAVSSVSFSENGYYMASGAEDGGLKVWDLRKQINFQSAQFDQPVTSVSFDHSGSYLAAVSGGVRIFTPKTLEQVVSLSESAVDAKFTKDAQSLVTASATDKNLRTYAPKK